MYSLKKDCKLAVQGLGIVLTKNSSQDDFERALKHSPKLSNFIETKLAKDGKASNK
jgi:hypothetical protein